MDTYQDKDLDQLLNEHFAGRVVRKDLTKLIKEGANVPVYVLEYLLGMYCASDDSEVIEQGLKNVKTVLAENYVRPDEAEKVKSLVRERGTYKVIDRVGLTMSSALCSGASSGKTTELGSDGTMDTGRIWGVSLAGVMQQRRSRGYKFDCRETDSLRLSTCDLPPLGTGAQARYLVHHELKEPPVTAPSTSDQPRSYAQDSQDTPAPARRAQSAQL